jgi:hypothetical protein
MGPELLFEYRYSTMINTVFISLMFGAGMPVLYLFGFIAFFLAYWVDKWTLFRIYQTPPRYNKELNKVSREWLNVAIIIHFVFSFWMYSNSIIFDSENVNIFGVDVSSTTEGIDEDYSWLDLGDRLNQYHSLIYLIAFLVFVIIFLVKALLIRWIAKCLGCCCKNRKRKLLLSMIDQSANFSNNYYTCLDRLEFNSVSTRLRDDIEKFKSFKRDLETRKGNGEEDFTEEEVDYINWLIERLKDKRKEVEEAYKNKDKTHSSINDFSYDIRDLKPYKFYISKMEKDMQKEREEMGVVREEPVEEEPEVLDQGSALQKQTPRDQNQPVLKLEINKCKDDEEEKEQDEEERDKKSEPKKDKKSKKKDKK